MNGINWVTSARWQELTGHTDNYVRNMLSSGDWIEGVHYKRTGERTLWLNVRNLDDWVEKHSCVQSKAPKCRRGSKSEGIASA